MTDEAAEEAELDIATIVDTLNRHRVVYVIIGGVAAQAWAASVGVDIRPTLDIDVTPAPDISNLERLSAALDELGARIRAPGAPEGLPFNHDGSSLVRARTWNLVCQAGPFDISLTPSGTDGYPDIARHARVVTLEGIEAPLADLADVIRSKRAANRPKDIEVLPALEEALRRRGAGPLDQLRARGDVDPASGDLADRPPPLPRGITPPSRNLEALRRNER